MLSNLVTFFDVRAQRGNLVEKNYIITGMKISFL
jgi:hypothetical protein